MYYYGYELDVLDETIALIMKIDPICYFSYHFTYHDYTINISEYNILKKKNV